MNDTEMSDDKMVDCFGNACLKAGKSNSGLCISAAAEYEWADMQKWRSALKERIKKLRADAKEAKV
jgi:hypothetical protein